MIRKTLLCLILLMSSSVLAQIGGDFQLVDHHGVDYRLEQDRGKFVLLFFGYTTCPDVCPESMGHVASVFEHLAEHTTQLNGIFVTVDPERDTVARLSEYVPWFSEDLVGLTGTPEAIDRVVTQYSARYQLHKSTTDDVNYLVDHSADLYLIGPDGVLEVVIPFGLPVEHTVGIIKKRLSKFKNNTISALPVTLPIAQDKRQTLFSLEDAVRWQSLHDQPLLLNFWASWCGPCRAEIPSLNKSLKIHQNLPLQMVAINIGETPQAVRSFLGDYPIEFPVVLDPAGDSFDRWQLTGLPTTLLFNSQGDEVMRIVGERDWSSFEVVQAIREAVAE